MRLGISQAILLVASVAAQEPAKANVAIGAINYRGSGCPQGSVSSTVSDDKSLVTFGFDKFQALFGPTVPRTDNRRDCDLTLRLEYLAGYQVTVVNTVYHGYTRLDNGVNARFTTDYDFGTNKGRKHHAEASIDGDARGRDARGKRSRANKFEKNHPHKIEGGEWSECGAKGGQTMLVVKNNLVLSSRNQTATGEFAVDDETVTPKATKHEVSFGWRKCA